MCVWISELSSDLFSSLLSVRVNYVHREGTIIYLVNKQCVGSLICLKFFHVRVGPIHVVHITSHVPNI